MLERLWQWFKKWFLDGWLTSGPQIDTPDHLVKAFARCNGCGHIWPHWRSNITGEELKSGKVRPLGCRHCGGTHLRPCIIPSWESLWWFLVRGKLIRKVLLRKRLWDPRIPVMLKDKA